MDYSLINPNFGGMSANLILGGGVFSGIGLWRLIKLTRLEIETCCKKIKCRLGNQLYRNVFVFLLWRPWRSQSDVKVGWVTATFDAIGSFYFFQFTMKIWKQKTLLLVSTFPSVLCRSPMTSLMSNNDVNDVKMCNITKVQK